MVTRAVTNRRSPCEAWPPPSERRAGRSVGRLVDPQKTEHMGLCEIANRRLLADVAVVGHAQRLDPCLRCPAQRSQQRGHLTLRRRRVDGGWPVEGSSGSQRWASNVF
jgi:hypothetical protein